MRVRETQLPGIGLRYALDVGDGREFVVVLHNDGDREVYWREAADTDAERLFELSESDARKLSEILDGTYFQLVGEDLEAVLQDSRVKWIHVASESPLVGKTIAESQIRTDTGVSIIAIQRPDHTVSNPSRDETIREEDVLVTVGTEEQYGALDRLLE